MKAVVEISLDAHASSLPRGKVQEGGPRVLRNSLTTLRPVRITDQERTCRSRSKIYRVPRMDIAHAGASGKPRSREQFVDATD